MEQCEGGWQPVGDKYACSKCFEDYAIAEFIRSQGESGCCSYCGRRRTVAHMEDLLRFISKGILRRYEDPANSVGYDSAEGGYLITPTDGYDLVGEIFEGSNDGLLDDLRSAYASSHWVRQDPLWPSRVPNPSHARARTLQNATWTEPQTDPAATQRRHGKVISADATPP